MLTSLTEPFPVSLSRRRVECRLTLAVYIFYWYGPQIRARSKFAQTLASDRKTMGDKVNEKRLAKSSKVEG